MEIHPREQCPWKPLHPGGDCSPHPPQSRALTLGRERLPLGRVGGDARGAGRWKVDFFSFLFFSFFLSFFFFFFGCCFCCLKWSETRQEAAWEKVEQKWKNTNSPAANGLSVQTKVFSGLSPSAPTPARARTPANTLTWSHTRARAHIYTHTDTHAHTHALPGEGRAARVQHETATQ